MTNSSLVSWRELVAAVKSLTGHRALAFWILVLCLLAGLSGLLAVFNQAASVTVAAPGGALTEGIVGSPRLVNPLLAASDADRDLTTLIYSGLWRVGPDGEPLPDLVQDYTVSADQLIYTIKLKNNLRWHDGVPLTADDVKFTFEMIKNPLSKSPKRPLLETAEIETLDHQTLRLVLKEPNPWLPENLTVGILPQHIWQAIDPGAYHVSKFNLEGVGSGPYRVVRIERNDLGVPIAYQLQSFEGFALGTPKIKNLTLRFFDDEPSLLDAYRRGEIQSFAALSAKNLPPNLEGVGSQVIRAPLPRIFGVFFNQNRAPVFANPEIRRALDLAADRAKIIATVLRGYARSASGPLPSGTPKIAPLDEDEADNKREAANDLSSPRPADLNQAQTLLASQGWKNNSETGILEKKTGQGVTTFDFRLDTLDTPELKEAALLLKESWEKLGAKVTLRFFPLGDLNQEVIRPRQYESLLFGEILGRRPDLFSFWHSSQRLDPGLNIALYTNLTVDRLLNELKTVADPSAAIRLSREIEEEIRNDAPAVFLFSPDFLYVLPRNVQNVILPPINIPADRFLQIQKWYLETEKVWKIFADQNDAIN